MPTLNGALCKDHGQAILIGCVKQRGNGFHNPVFYTDVLYRWPPIRVSRPSSYGASMKYVHTKGEGKGEVLCRVCGQTVLIGCVKCRQMGSKILQSL